MAEDNGEDGYTPSSNEILLAAMMMSASGALHDTLIELAAAAHGGLPGPWLDQLQASFISHAKSIGTDSVPMELEVAAVEAAIANIDRVIDWVKADLEPTGEQTD